MIVQVNGEKKELAHDTTLLQLISDLNLKPERVAAELNGLVVPRPAWPITWLNDGDRIEIVHFVGGGYWSPQKGAKNTKRSRQR